ncbi:MAG: PadR family transcriptional regulator [Chloroflexota bacterium]
MAQQKDKEALYDNLSGELRRGALVLAVLSQLSEEQYGYLLKQALSDQGLEINEGTLYPLLRRLEKQGLLESSWQVVDDKRPRRYYKISPLGEGMLTNLTHEWQSLVTMMTGLLNGH